MPVGCQTQQFIHLLTNNGIGFSNDIWVPATTKISPQLSRQFSVGIFKHFLKSGISLSVEAYHKTFEQQIDYPEGTNFLADIGNKSWQDAVSKNGIGYSSGVEFFANKTKGRFTGLLSYTLSKSERRFDDINQGQWYPVKYDRRHMLNMTGSYRLSNKWRINTSWVYQTGSVITLPVASYYYVSSSVLDVRHIYAGRNNARMSDYHRLDFGVNRTSITKKGYEVQWSFGAYNAYNQANSYFVNIDVANGVQPNEPQRLVVKQYSLFPVIPYVSYFIKF